MTLLYLKTCFNISEFLKMIVFYNFITIMFDENLMLYYQLFSFSLSAQNFFLFMVCGLNHMIPFDTCHQGRKRSREGQPLAVE